MMKSISAAGIGLIALSGAAAARGTPARPMLLQGVGVRPNGAARAALPTWTFDWTYQGQKYDAVFVGTDPTGGRSTTVPVYIIPIRLFFKTSSGTITADPTAKDDTGRSPVDTTLDSPIFHTGITWKQGATDIGNTQYGDAFQRAALWGTVKAHAGYHVLLGTPTVERRVSFTVPAADGKSGTAYGVKVIEAEINWFDSVITPLLTTLKLPANSLPIFITTQAYLTEGSACCIGGYHNYTGTQAYLHFTFISNSTSTLAFSQDVSALSEQVGKWMDDPLAGNTNIPAVCGEQGNEDQIYEVGDPIEADKNYGDYPYVLKGVTYHLRDLVLPTYFGAPTSTTANGWSSFQGTTFSVCQNGG
jgi:hypothetical protein